jgi:ElaB/YqjD/DUF883 family membrane-anchored ribosome-binding protein
MLNKPANQARVTALVKDLADYHTKGKPLVDRYHELRQNSAALKASADAAEADARRLRGEIRELLNKLIGRPSKEMRAKSAEQRAAIELAEDYRELAQDLEDDIALAHIDACLASEDMPYRRNRIVAAYGELLLEETLADIAPRLKAAMDKIWNSGCYASDSDFTLIRDVAKERRARFNAYLCNAIHRATEKVEPIPTPAEITDALTAYPSTGLKTPTGMTIVKTRGEIEERRKAKEKSIFARLFG